MREGERTYVDVPNDIIALDLFASQKSLLCNGSLAALFNQFDLQWFLLCAEKYSIRRNSIFSIRFFVDLDDLIVINIDLLFDLIVILNTVES